jgi:Fe-S oxidoreductase
MIENVIMTTENCRYCLMCRHVCPVGHVTRKETLTPHGWGLTIASVRRGLMEWDESTVDVLYSCADCGTCRAHCVTDQPLPSAIAAARNEVSSQDKAPEIVYTVHNRLQEWGNPYVEKHPEIVEEQADFALFVGDDARYLDGGTLDAVLQLLNAVGVQPVLIGVGRNNGYLAASLGFPETAASLAQSTLDELVSTGARTMLVLTPGDYYVFNQLLDERLGIEWPTDIIIQELVPFLYDRQIAGELKLKPATGTGPYAYVDPTHSVRVTGRYDAPRSLLSAVMTGPAHELFWRRERSHPCGNVALEYTQPHIANHLTYSRLADAQQSGAQLIVTEDPGSLVQLRKHAFRFNLEVQGLYQLLARQII